jgi:hypothetical protein
MKETTQEILFCTDQDHWTVLEQIVREGARKMLQVALENEVNEYIDTHRNIKIQMESR